MTRPEVRTPGGSRANAETRTSTAILPRTDAERKAIATGIARAALAGVAVYELAGGGFLAVLGVGITLDDLDALQAFLSRLDGKP